MKKALALILALVMALGLVACGNNEANTPVSAEQGSEEVAHKVGISMTSQMQQRWALEGELLKSLCEEKGLEAVLTWANDDAVQQAADIENLVAQGCDVLIVCPVDQDALDTALATADEAGCWIISYDRQINSTSHVDYLLCSCELEAIAPTWANFFINKFNLDADDGKTYTIEFFGGSPTESVAGMWVDDTVKGLQKYLDSGKLVCRSGQMTLAECGIENWDTSKAQDRMDNLLTAHYSDGTYPDMVLSPNDSIAMGIVNSLKNAGFNDPENFPVITGQDCDIANMKLMVEGFIAHNLFKNTKQLAKLTVEAVADHYAGKEPVVNGEYNNNTIVVPTQYLAVTEITPENWYNELVVNAGYYTLDDLGLTEADIPQ